MAVFCLTAQAAGDAPAPGAATPEDTNALDTLRGIIQLQEQVHATQLAIERARAAADADAARNAEIFATSLQNIEQSMAAQRDSLAAQRSQELEAIRNSNRNMLVLAGTFAVFGFLAMLLTAIVQSRAIHRLAQISAALPAPRLFGPAASLAAPGLRDTPLVTAGAAEQSNLRLLGAIDRLEQRLLQLERGTQPALNAGAPGEDHSAVPAGQTNGQRDDGAASVPPSAGSDAARFGVLMAKGQSLLSLDKAEAALACFDEVLAASPNHSEALVKKGTALERLRKLDEAIECYDRAIAADGSLTIAYLYKGGLFNRQERFSEALACYEQALRTQEKRGA